MIELRNYPTELPPETKEECALLVGTPTIGCSHKEMNT